MEELINIEEDSFRRFIKRWHGITVGTTNATFSTARKIPHELLDWHEATAAAAGQVIAVNRPVAKQELKRSEDGLIVFWIENQGVYHWATDPNTIGCEVYWRKPGSSPWQRTGETLLQFLTHCTVSEAIVGAASKFAAIIPASLLNAHSLVDFSMLPFPALANEEASTRLLASDNALARVAPPPVGYGRADEQSWMLTVAATSEAPLAKYRARLNDYVLPARTHQGERTLVEDPPF